MVSRRPPVSQHPLPSLAARVGGGDDTLMPSVAIKSGGIYCRKCGYDLRGQAEMHRCPECGQGFDPAEEEEDISHSADGTGGAAVAIAPAS